MKKITQELSHIVSKIDGKVIYIGEIEEMVLEKLKTNKKIIYCDLLNTGGGGFSKKRGKNKSLNINDFKKFYKKKKLDYVIGNMNDLKRYLPKFISTSVYICHGYIYLYGENKEELDKIKKKYKRYKAVLDIMEYENGYLVKIDVTNSKNNYILDKLYYIYDCLGVLMDKISDLIIGG